MTTPSLVFFGALAVFIAATPVVSRAQPAQSSAPAVRPERVFIVRAGGDYDHVVEGENAGDQAYDELFAAMTNWGRFELVADPSRADWIFEISGRVQVAFGDLPPEYRLDLVVRDAKGAGAEKGFYADIIEPSLFSTWGRRLRRAITELIHDVKEEVGDPTMSHPFAGPRASLAPTPARISSARKVFIEYSGPHEDEAEKYSGPWEQVNTQLSAAIKKWQRFELVPTGAEADLVFQVIFSELPICWGSESGCIDHRLRFNILDPESRALLWVLTTHVQSADFEHNARRNFARAVDSTLGKAWQLQARPSWAADAHTAAVAPSAPDLIQVTASAPEDVVKIGSDFHVNVAVTNLSHQNLKIPHAHGFPRTCAVEVTVADGNLASDTGVARKEKDTHARSEKFLNYLLPGGWPDTPDQGFLVYPGATNRTECQVSRLHEMTRPGEYRIRVLQVDGRLVESNTLMVTVVP